MKDKIEKMLELLSTLTQEEAENVKDIIKWDNETQTAFLLAKTIFEEKQEG